MRYELIILILLGLLFYEWTGLSPGGIVTAGYLVVYERSMVQIGLIIALSLLVYGVMQLLSKEMILFGRRKLTVSIFVLYLCYFIFDQTLGFFWPLLSLSFFNGTILPALISRDMEKQGVLKTVLSLLLVVGMGQLVLLFLREVFL